MSPPKYLNIPPRPHPTSPRSEEGGEGEGEEKDMETDFYVQCGISSDDKTALRNNEVSIKKFAGVHWKRSPRRRRRRRRRRLVNRYVNYDQLQGDS